MRFSVFTMQTPEHSELCLMSSQINTFNLSRLWLNGFCTLVMAT